ncbi:MAG: phage holin family protein [Chloroflexota bacterium]|nr:phage holin family protein [Chloroflexota bacterium]
MDRPKEDRSLGELFGELSRESSALVRQEMALAKTELTQKAAKVGKDVGFLAVGGAIAYAGFLALVAALIFALASFIPAWLAALIVGLVVAGVGYFLVQKGLSALKQENLAPEQTIDTLKEDTAWAKKQIS